MSEVYPLEARFWARVDKDGPVVREELGPCWEWTGTRRSDGYGIMHVPGSANYVRAHRFSWEMAHGAIPPGMLACHHCDNRACVRPDHLFLGTHDDNMRDGVAKGRFPRTPKPREQVRFGAAHPLSKLTEADVREIRRLRQTHGLGYIAKRFGVCKATICLICTRQTWKHVKE